MFKLTRRKRRVDYFKLHLINFNIFFFNHDLFIFYMYDDCLINVVDHLNRGFLGDRVTVYLALRTGMIKIMISQWFMGWFTGDHQNGVEPHYLGVFPTININ